MKTVYSLLICMLSLFIAQCFVSAQSPQEIKPIYTTIANDTDARFDYILSITGPNLIEVNTVNVYGFSEYSNYSGTGYSYRWTLLCADDLSISPFFMGYNSGSTCSFICYEPVNLFLWLDVYCPDDEPGHPSAHGETMVTVLPAGSL